MVKYSIQIDPSITTADGVATPEDYRSLHDVANDPEYTGEGVTVAMVDSGIDTSHPFFSDKDIRDGFDATDPNDPTGAHTDKVGHNTWNITCPMQAFAPDATVYPIRVFGDKGRTSWDTLKRAYRHLYEQSDEIDIVTFALGATRKIDKMDRRHRKLADHGILDVTSAGNSGRGAGSPATAQGAFTIGAVDENGKVTNFSSFQDEEGVPDVTMIGRNVIGAQTGDGRGIGRAVSADDVPDELADYGGEWMKASGTSVSAPAAAFAAAAWFEKHPEANVLTAQSTYMNTARDAVDGQTGDPDDGEGIATHRTAMGSKSSGEADTTITGTVWSLADDSRDWLQLDADVFEDGEYEFNREQLLDAANKLK